MFDRFSAFAQNLTSPVGDGFAITPDDGNDLPQLTRALYVGEGGDLAVKLQSGTDIVLKSVPTGALLPLRVRQVKAATTAGSIVGLC